MYRGHILKIQNSVAPAKAGAYLACRFTQRDAMGPSLRWGDDVMYGEVVS
jgi:hypothetical protein